MKRALAIGAAVIGLTALVGGCNSEQPKFSEHKPGVLGLNEVPLRAATDNGWEYAFVFSCCNRDESIFNENVAPVSDCYYLDLLVAHEPISIMIEGINKEGKPAQGDVCCLYSFSGLTNNYQVRYCELKKEWEIQ